jgi:hypothetical protein
MISKKGDDAVLIAAGTPIALKTGKGADRLKMTALKLAHALAKNPIISTHPLEVLNLGGRRLS